MWQPIWDPCGPGSTLHIGPILIDSWVPIWKAGGIVRVFFGIIRQLLLISNMNRGPEMVPDSF